MTKKAIKILAIETSCDETAAAIIEAGNRPKILSNVVSSQIELHQKYGGVFPEVASRAHTERIIPVVEQALKDKDFDVIAVTVGPGLIGSLLVGVNSAKALAYATGKPIIGINHWLGHIYSAFGGENSKHEARNPKLPKFPILALIVSGGHTGLVLVKSHRDIQPLGETLDDAAGEAFDKVAKLLQLGYPGGPAIAAAAAKIHNSEFRIHNLSFPRSMLDRKDYNFSFSGLKTAVLYKVKELQSQGITLNHYQSPIAFEFQQAVIDILIGKTLQAAQEFKPKSIILCGGVSANKELREQMQKAVVGLPYHPSFHVPAINLSTDNAAMIGLAAAYHLDELTTWDKITADANLRLK